MKFVIRSLLFLSLLLQTTGSLRKCFNDDQNIIMIIILLAFSIIGLLGLFIGSRFILIIFSASMTLILIASVTIYAIGRTDQDSMRPRVPYYTNVPIEQLDEAVGRRLGVQDGESRLKSLVGKWFNKSQHGKGKNSRANGTAADGDGDRSRSRQFAKKSAASQASATSLPATIAELSDESTSLVQSQDDSSAERLQLRSPLAASAPGKSKVGPLPRDDQAEHQEEHGANPRRRPHGAEPDGGSDFAQIESDQWVAYERHLYEKYLRIVSQSIDLVMLTILSAWMALLLDEDSDHCFGSNDAGRRRAGQAPVPGKEAPVYNYNGVRYSIRSEVPESLTRVVVH